tara:strand:- start:30 stop:698 length:669 start_codon:yes stop_codon:yes gene_type:complete
MKYRKEKKFLIPLHYYKEAEFYFKSHFYRFKNQYPDRQVNSIYFDDPNFTSYSDSISGISKRYKYRLRWYKGINQSDKSVYFENKFKYGEAGSKYIFRVGKLDDFLSLEKKSFRKKVLKSIQLDKDYKLIISNYLMSLKIEYKRKYLISRDNLIRVTFDNQLKYSIPGNKPFIDKNFFIQSNCCVIEIKYDNEYTLDNTFSDFLNSLSRNSKFTNGIELMYL